MRGPFRESEPAETPPHRAEFRFSFVQCCPLPARGARDTLRRAATATKSKGEARIEPYFISSAIRSTIDLGVA
jgi:hypothetical protein